MSESPGAREEVVRLKWYVVAATVALITLLEVFYLTVVEVPPVECLIQWIVVTGLALALIHFTFTMALREHDRVDQQARQLARPLAEGEKDRDAIRRLAYHDELTGLPNRALF